MKNLKNLGHIGMILSAFLITISFLVSAHVTKSIDPLVFNAFRFLLAGLLFLPYILFKFGLKFPGWKNLGKYLILSIPLVTFFSLMLYSLNYTTALNTSVLFTTLPIITSIYAITIKQEKYNHIKTIGLLLGLLGALWIIFKGSLGGFLNFSFNTGDYIFIVGVLILGTYGPLIKFLHSGEAIAIMTFWTLIMGSLLLFIISGGVHLDVIVDLESDIYLGMFYIAFFTTLITFFLQQFSTVQIGATQTSMYNYLIPLFLLIITVFIGTESFMFEYIPGLIFIVLGIFYVIKQKA